MLKEPLNQINESSGNTPKVSSLTTIKTIKTQVIRVNKLRAVLSRKRRGDVPAQVTDLQLGARPSPELISAPSTSRSGPA